MWRASIARTFLDAENPRGAEAQLFSHSQRGQTAHHTLGCSHGPRDQFLRPFLCALKTFLHFGLPKHRALEGAVMVVVMGTAAISIFKYSSRSLLLRVLPE